MHLISLVYFYCDIFTFTDDTYYWTTRRRWF